MTVLRHIFAAIEIDAILLAEMEIKARSLRTFCALYEGGSLERAGARVSLSPSAVSRIIADLEADLGIVLFDRTDRRLRPTAAGQAFHQRAREALLLWDDLAGFGRSLGRPAVSPLRVAALSRHAETLVAPAVASLLAGGGTSRLVKIDIHAQRDFAFSRLARPFDIGFGHLAGDHPDLHRITLGPSEICVIAPPDNPLSRETTVVADALEGVPLVQLSRDTIIGRLVASGAGQARLRVIAETSHTLFALRLVQAGVGVHITDRFAAVHAARAGCVIIPLAGVDPVDICAFWPRGATAEPPDITRLIQSVRLEMESARGASA